MREILQGLHPQVTCSNSQWLLCGWESQVFLSDKFPERLSNPIHNNNHYREGAQEFPYVGKMGGAGREREWGGNL